MGPNGKREEVGGAAVCLEDDRELMETHRKLEAQILKMHQRLSQPVGTAARVRTVADLDKAQSRLSELEADLEEIQQRIDARHQEPEQNTQGVATDRMPNESRRDYLIRTGKITPFAKMGTSQMDGPLASLQDALIDAEDERDEAAVLEESKSQTAVSYRHLRVPGFAFDARTGANSEDEESTLDRPTKRRRRQASVAETTVQETSMSGRTETILWDEDEEDSSISSVDPEITEPSSSEEDNFTPENHLKRSSTGRRTPKPKTGEGVEDLTGLDDGNEQIYQSRLQSWVSRRAAARKRGDQKIEEGAGEQPNEDRDAVQLDEWRMPHPSTPDTELSCGYRLPGDVYPYLFDYQKTGVQWLWELYQQHVGGIVGDEMGLGKTIQVISFLAGLHYSNKLTKPIIVVAPATVMKQWVNEFHRWWPPFRVSILHTSGSGMINVRSETRREDALASQLWDPRRSGQGFKGPKAAKRIVQRVVEDGHVLVTTYSGLQTYASLLIPVEWGGAILDEGHKIRNPNTAITICCKELRTPHRLILSGTPMQNNLTELWSLFDFVFPMRLGTLVNFRNQFEFPIRQGGYANATNLQVQTAAKCAEMLKEAISPYLLQRFKVDVAADLPKKSEQVLFCRLTKVQRTAYETFLNSEEMKLIFNGRRQVLYGVDILRKICNHPDLQNRKELASKSGYGNASKSGKMQVVKSLLELWRDTGHKTLLFAQHRMMLDILEIFIKSLSGFRYRRMDGDTPIQNRQRMVDEFNADPGLHVFLLTTKVGGLGVNLTGADRVIIYDPDWNPSTDVQARERAWRLGQKREVTIYRLMTAGTIEEKIYHRQIFKQFLTNKILKDPKQRQTFQMSDLHDLFTLGDDGPTETSTLFKHAEVIYEDPSQAPASLSSSRAPKTSGESENNLQDEKRDISNVAGVSSVEMYQDGQNLAGAPGASSSEARLMESIFAQSGVHSALEHDRVVNGKRVVKADPNIIEAEARKIAAEAAAELRQSETAARSVPIGTPTWTGQFGIAGKPGENPMSQPAGTPSVFGRASGAVRRGGSRLSSASILTNLANRTVTSDSRSGLTGGQSVRSTPDFSGAGPPSNADFITLIRDYIVSHGGSVYTQMLIDHFNRLCTTPQRSAEFKEMLKQIAVLEKGGRNGRGKWSLKAEYAKRKA